MILKFVEYLMLFWSLLGFTSSGLKVLFGKWASDYYVNTMILFFILFLITIAVIKYL